MVLKKAIDMPKGSLVIPKKHTVFLSPQFIELAEDIENWIEWPPNQFGIVLNVMDNDSSLLIATATGTGVCFVDEIIRV